MTYTYAVLDVSREAYDEIRGKLEAAGYQHAFHDDLIDMHGIALKAGAADSPQQRAPIKPEPRQPLTPHLHDVERAHTCWCGAKPNEPHRITDTRNS